MAKQRELSDDELDRELMRGFQGNQENAAYINEASNSDDFTSDGFELDEVETVRGGLKFNFADFDKKQAEIKQQESDEEFVRKLEDEGQKREEFDDFINDEEFESGEF